MTDETYLFYDTETTGTNTKYSIPLQYAAIRTNNDMKTLEEIDIRCKLPMHIIPYPGALQVTHINPYDIANNQYTLYEFAKEINRIQRQYNNTIFVGHNIIKYDEEIIRSLMYMNLQERYISSNPGNRRIDTLKLLQVMHAFAPGIINTNLNENGNHIFKLEQIAELNGFHGHNAHDALGDVQATMFIFNLLREREPEIFALANKLTEPKYVEAMITKARENREPLYYMDHYGKPEWKCLYPIAKFQKKWGMIDLTQDTTKWTQYNADEWYLYISSKYNKQESTNNNTNTTEEEIIDQDDTDPDSNATHDFYSIATNKQPPIFTQAMLEEINVNPLSLNITNMPDNDTLYKRIQSLQGEKIRLTCNNAMEKEVNAYPKAEEIEEEIYEKGFPSNNDKDIIQQFHYTKEWEKRKSLISDIEDETLQRIARRIIFIEKPEILTNMNAYQKAIIQKRLYNNHPKEESTTENTHPKKRKTYWASIPNALIEATELHAKHQTEETQKILQWYQELDQYYRTTYPEFIPKEIQE